MGKCHLVQRFTADWRAKYHAEFHIIDAGVTFRDITADDLRRSRRDTPLELTPTTQPGAAPTAAAQAAAARGDAAGQPTNPSDQRTASGARIPRTDPASLKPLSERLIVQVPGIADAAATDVRLMRIGPRDFKFAGRAEVDLIRLQSDVDRHLSAAMVDETKWPADVHQAERAVAQHLLMAVAEYQAGAPSAQPAAARLPANHAPAEEAAPRR